MYVAAIEGSVSASIVLQREHWKLVTVVRST